MYQMSARIVEPASAPATQLRKHFAALFSSSWSNLPPFLLVLLAPNVHVEMSTLFALPVSSPSLAPFVEFP